MFVYKGILIRRIQKAAKYAIRRRQLSNAFFQHYCENLILEIAAILDKRRAQNDRATCKIIRHNVIWLPEMGGNFCSCTHNFEAECGGAGQTHLENPSRLHQTCRKARTRKMKKTTCRRLEKNRTVYL